MKNFKRIASLLLAMTMILCMGLPIFADEGGTGTTAQTYTITINEATKGYTYSAYQIFAGKLSVKDDNSTVLSDITWGSGINAEKDKLMTALKALEFDVEGESGTTKEKLFEKCTSAAEVAEVLSAKNTGKDNEVAKAFAQVVGDYLTETAQGTSTYADNKYTIAGLEAGYYLVKNTTVPENATDETYTRYILEVVRNVEVTHKGEVPKVEKKIVEGETKTDVNDAVIGEEVKYELTATLPSNIKDYKTYYLKFTDTLSKGLTLNGVDGMTIAESAVDDGYKRITSGFTVKIGEQDVTEYFYIGCKDNEDGSTEIIVVIKDLKALEKLEGFTAFAGNEKVVVSYSAKVDTDAVIADKGNPNTVKIEFSNDPNHSGEGTTAEPEKPTKPGEPDKDIPTGETPEDTVITYVTELGIFKYIGGTDPKTPLAGAKFRITGTKYVTDIKTYESFVEDGIGTFYPLTDGTFTTTEPTEATKDNYVDGTDAKKYAKTTETVTIVSPETVYYEAVSGQNGELTFTGLAAGTYTITEIVTPEGYNTIAPITFTITFTYSDKNSDKVNNTLVSITTNNESIKVGEDNKLSTEIANNSGSTLPSTGGIGTTIFYIVGGVLLAGAVVLLITKRRMSIDE